MRYHFDPILTNLICPFFFYLFRIFFWFLHFWSFTAVYEAWRKPHATWTINGRTTVADGGRSGCAGVDRWCEAGKPPEKPTGWLHPLGGPGAPPFTKVIRNAVVRGPQLHWKDGWGRSSVSHCQWEPVREGGGWGEGWGRGGVNKKGLGISLGWSTHPSSCPTWRSITGSRSTETSTLLAQK